MIELKKILPNPDNPRVIKDENFEKLCKSIKEFPKMMALRPIIVREDWVVLGGNMRRKALEHLGYEKIPKDWVKFAKDFTEEEQKRFLITDNVGFGEWDEIKQRLKLKIVRRGGYKKGSPFDASSIERVIKWNDFKERYDADSDTE